MDQPAGADQSGRARALSAMLRVVHGAYSALNVGAGVQALAPFLFLWPEYTTGSKTRLYTPATRYRYKVIRMLKLVRQPIEVDVPEADLITPSDAARITGRRLQNVVNLMETDRLPVFLLPQDERIRRQKFTSRAAVLALPKHRRPAASPARKRK